MFNIFKIFLPPACFFVLIASFIQSCQSHSSVNDSNAINKKTTPLFQLLPAEKTNIDFNNRITEGLNTNVLMYEYFYNGGGVAVGDINGDEMEDIYFSANMTENRLYLNQGNMEFTDVTNTAGVAGRQGPWKTGVTMADVNGDGKLDLYLCYSGKLPGHKRQNELYINLGNNSEGIPIFKEMALNYGLADSAYSTQAAFFDYDVDGDLDLFLLNHNPHSLPIIDEVTSTELLKKNDPMAGSKLFRNDIGNDGIMHFKDVTPKSGISSTSLSYGLGVGISDIDKNGLPDIYVSNDYDVPDYLYINNGDGTFTDQLKTRLRYNTKFSMGNDLADINNDGLNDIFTLDMLPEDNKRQKLLRSPDNYELFSLNIKAGFHYQYMRNMLQLNLGNGRFSEIGQLAGVSGTDWSWAALLADYDNDGWQDLFVTNGYLRDYTNLDFVKYMGDYIQNNKKLWRKDLLELVHKMPSSEIVNHIYKNNGDLTFEDKRKAWGFMIPSNSNGAAYVDLDNDGDLDLVVNNIDAPAFIYENKSENQLLNNYLKVKLVGKKANTSGIGAQITLFYQGQKQYREQMPVRGYQSSVSPVIHFGLGKTQSIDSLEIIWPGGKGQILHHIKPNQVITLYQEDAKAIKNTPSHQNTVFKESQSPFDFQHKPNTINDFKRQPLMVYPQSFSGPCMVKGDVNGDHIDDFFVGGATGQQGVLFIARNDGTFVVQNSDDFQADKACEDTDAIFFDADNNGSLDLYVASGGYHNFTSSDHRLQDRLYLNDGDGNFTKSILSIPEMYTSTGKLTILDVNGDGNQDLFVGGRVVPGRYPESPQSYLLVNDGKGHFRDLIGTISPELQYAGMVTEAATVDLNSDGYDDLIVVGEWMPIKVLINEAGKLTDRSGKYFDKEYSGWWSSLLVEDFNKDGNPDIIVGNFGLNSQFNADENKPVELFYKDYDKNGSIDPILCHYIQDQSFPYVNRDELLEQLTMLRSRFTDYRSYADATIKDIFHENEMKGTKYLKINSLETSYFQGNSEGRFTKKTLPLPTQFSPVYTITSIDYNKDGKTDLILCGNINQAGLKLGKLGANYGILLKGTDDGNFSYVPQNQSGLDLQGDVRSVSRLNNLILFGINQSDIKAYKVSTMKTPIY